MPYGNERKAPAVNIEDAKKIMEMVWHQEEVMVALSDGSEVCLKNDHGSQEPDISADRSYEIHPEPLEKLVFRLLETKQPFIVQANGQRKICGYFAIARVN